MTQVANAGTDNVAPQRTPGYLMASFGWAAMPLAAMLEADPSLYAALFTIRGPRVRFEKLETLLRVALDMRGNAEGLSLADIERDFGISRRTAERMRDAIE